MPAGHRVSESPAGPLRRMTLWPLVGALYFMVSGGPYGLEELAQDVGFGEGIALLAVTPLAWSLPTALMVGELAAALPEEGGYYAWVRRALGPFWGCQEAWLSLAASVFDMAIYPTLFALYLERLFPSLGAPPVVVKGLVVAVAAACNLAGAAAIGEGSAILTLLLLAPFAVLATLALHAGHAPGAAGAPPSAGAHDLAGAVLVAMWNNMGWDNASTVAGEVHRPQRTYPLAVLVAVTLVTLTYVLPFAAMAHAGVDASTFSTGAWATVAGEYGGPALAAAVVGGGMISAFGMYSALCLSYSRLPVVLAEDGYLPRALTRRLDRSGAPWVSVLACSVAWTLSLTLSFERLVGVDILLYGGSLVLEFVALLALRVREPELPRPFRIPGGVPALIALAAGPVALLGFAVVKTAGDHVGGANGLLFGLVIALLGPAAYAATTRLYRTGRPREP
jgi:amino acid transporter